MPKEMTQALSISSRIWLTRSTWPLVWGWKAVLKRMLVPMAFWKESQNLEVKMLPRSEEINCGMPCKETILEVYSSANWAAVIDSLIGRKWATLVSLSMTTKIASFPRLDLGNPVTKSISIWSNFHSGMARGGGDQLAVGVLLSLFCRHHIHSRTEQSRASFKSTNTTAWGHVTSLYFQDE